MAEEEEKPMPSAHGNSIGTLDTFNSQDIQYKPVKKWRLRIVMMLVLVSMGGLVFGYDTGLISGFLVMGNYRRRFGDITLPDGQPGFSQTRSGTIVGLFSIGTLVGALAAAPIADKFGRKNSISFWCTIFIGGIAIQISAITAWYQIVIGRTVAGLGVGALSVLTPMYQSETAPRQVRGALVSAYQLFITFGIFIAYCINAGTENFTSSLSWRLPMGIGFTWPFILGIGIQFFPESPRWDCRQGNVDKAKNAVALTYGAPRDHPEVLGEMSEIQTKLAEEKGKQDQQAWHDFLTGPRMTYRVLLGMALQALQQLTGANFFFYYGTSIFKSTGLSNSFVTSIILGAVNAVTTIPAIFITDKYGRRICLFLGGLWMGVWLLVFASVGHFSLSKTDPASTPTAGKAMIAAACFFIAGFAMSWGPIVWAVCGEMYPSQYRAKCMGLATATNWSWNFLISFFTPYITAKIGYQYGYVFAACCFTGSVVVYLFVCETQGRSLEVIDTMYVEHVNPRRSATWRPESTASKGSPDAGILEHREEEA